MFYICDKSETSAVYPSLAFGLRFDFLENLSADINFMLFDQFDYNVSAYYGFSQKIKLGVGTLHYKYMLYSSIKSETIGFSVADYGFYVSPLFSPFYSDILKMSIKCNLGLLTFSKASDTKMYKKEESNEVTTYTFNNTNTLQPYVNPCLDMRVKIFNIKRKSLGIKLNAEMLYGKRHLEYDRLVCTWTANNVSTEKIVTDKHNFYRYNFNFGIYLAW